MIRLDHLEDGNRFDELCKQLLIAEYGDTFEVVDGFGGDGGLDGYDRRSRRLFAAYCPLLRTRGKRPSCWRDKARSDLQKVERLRSKYSYQIDEWVFLTPEDLRIEVQHAVREIASEHGVEPLFFGSSHLVALWTRHRQLWALFEDLALPDLRGEIADLRAMVESIGSQGHASHESVQPESDAGSGGSERILTPPDQELLVLMRAEATSPGEGNRSRLRAIASLDEDPLRQGWATLILLQELTPVDTDETERLGHALLGLASQLGLRAWESIARSKIAGALNYRYVDLDMYGLFMVKAGGAAGISPEHIRVRGKSLEDLRDLEKRATATLHDALAAAYNAEDPNAVLIALDVFAQGYVTRFMMKSMIGSVAATGDYKVARAAYESLIRLCRQVGDEQSLVSALYEFATFLWRSRRDDAVSVSAAQECLKLIESHGLAHRPIHRETLDGILDGSVFRVPLLM